MEYYPFLFLGVNAAVLLIIFVKIFEVFVCNTYFCAFNENDQKAFYDHKKNPQNLEMVQNFYDQSKSKAPESTNVDGKPVRVGNS